MIGGLGRAAAAHIMEAALVAVAIISTKAALDMARLQERLARDYYRMAKDLHDFYLKYYMPRENQFGEEIFNIPVYQPQFARRIEEFTNNIGIAFKGAMDNIASVGRYCTGLRQFEAQDIAVKQAVATGNAANAAIVYEISRQLKMDELLRNWKHRWLSLGRNIGTDGAAYAQIATNTAGGLGANAQNTAANAVGGAWYLHNRQRQNPPQNTPYQMAAGPESIPTPSQGDGVMSANRLVDGVTNNGGTLDVWQTGVQNN